jgi:hypothetical protein
LINFRLALWATLFLLLFRQLELDEELKAHCFGLSPVVVSLAPLSRCHFEDNLSKFMFSVSS